MTILVSLILFVVSIVLSELLRPKQHIEDARPSGLGDFNFPTATSDRVNPIVFGRVKILAPNVAWYGDLVAEPISKYFRQSYFSGKRVITGFRYYVGVQLAISRGPLDEFNGFWIGDKLVYSATLTPSGTGPSTFLVRAPSLFGGEETGGGGIVGDFDVYFGTSTQDPSEYLARFQAVGADINQQPAYVGSAYVVARRPQYIVDGVLTTPPGGVYVGTSTSIKPWAFEVTRFPALFSGQSAGDNKVSDTVALRDANPMNVIYEYLTNREWGRGELVGDIDVGPGSSFVSAATTLRNENNGFSMALTRLMPDATFLEEIERQIDGKVFLHSVTGKWSVKLARDDYDIDLVPELTVDNVLEVRDFTRGTWESTVNQVQVKFSNRTNEYLADHAFAQDTANMLMQGAGSIGTIKIVPGPRNYPGVFTAINANRIAWRDLRAESYPLARVTLVVDRTFWTVNLLDVLAWTDPQFQANKMAMRVIKIDRGTPTDSRITLTLVQDVFSFAAASFADPPATGWTAPDATLIAYPSTAQLAFEAPRAVVVRDPDFSGDLSVARVMVGALQQGPERSFVATQRNSSGTPSGSFFDAGEVFGFVYIGTLTSALNAGVANPVSSITVNPSFSGDEQILSAFEAATVDEVGVDLVQLVLIDSEFMLVRSAQLSGTNILLQNVYRGALDSAQASHAAGARVIVLGSGSALLTALFPLTQNVDVALRMVSLAGDVFAGSVTTIGLSMNKRILRPYPAAALLYNGVGTAFSTPSLEGAGSGIGGFRIDVAWWRRRYDTTNEATALLADDAATDASTEYQLEVRADPTGANTLVGSVSAWTTGAGPLQVSRADILTAAAAGTALRFLLKTRHDIGSEVDLESLQTQRHDVTPTSTLTGKFYFGGGIVVATPSASYTAVATGTFTLAIGAAQGTAAIQVSLNGGAFSTVIAAGLTSGTFSVTAGDTVRVQRTVSEAPNPNYVELRDPSTAIVAYGTFRN